MWGVYFEPCEWGSIPQLGEVQNWREHWSLMTSGRLHTVLVCILSSLSHFLFWGFCYSQLNIFYHHVHSTAFPNLPERAFYLFFTVLILVNDWLSVWFFFRGGISIGEIALFHKHPLRTPHCHAQWSNGFKLKHLQLFQNSLVSCLFQNSPCAGQTRKG